MRLKLGLGLSDSDGFNVLGVPSLELWLDANDTSTITESGGSVSQWSDKSGNGNHATQGTGSAQPTTSTRAINGLNALDFDGGDSLLISSIDFTDFAAFPELTIVAVLESDSVTGLTNILDQRSGSTGLLIRRNGADFEAGYFNTVGTYIARNAACFVVGEPVIVSMIISSTELKIFKNGVQIGTTLPTVYAGMGTNAVTPAIAGTGAYPKWDGAIVEFEAFNSALTDVQHQQLTNYLKNKWGIA